MSDGQSISELTSAHVAHLSKQRALIENHLADEESRRKYEAAAGKLGLLRALLESRAFDPTQTYELQCMGVVLGDALVQELGLRWIMVEDQYGRDPALAQDGCGEA